MTLKKQEDSREDLGAAAAERILSLKQPAESDSDFARRVGLSAQVVSNYRNRRHGASPDVIVTVARKTRTDPGWLLTGDHFGQTSAPGLPTDERVAARADAPAPPAAYAPDTPPNADLREMWRRIDAVDLREDLTPLQREMVKERELQAYRQATQDRETRVAEMRTRVMEREAEIADGRTRAIQAPAWRITALGEAQSAAIEVGLRAAWEYAQRHGALPAEQAPPEDPEGGRVAS